jgi:hypothetical protein
MLKARWIFNPNSIIDSNEPVTCPSLKIGGCLLMAGRRRRRFSIRIPGSFEIGIGSGFHRNTHVIITKGIAREAKDGVRLHPDGMQLKLDDMNRFFISSFHIILLLLPTTLRLRQSSRTSDRATLSSSAKRIKNRNRRYSSSGWSKSPSRNTNA